MSFKRWLVLGLLLILGLFLVNYVAGWIQANRLAETYFQDAEAAYAQGKYLDALTGYREFDPAQGKYVQRGGYLQVERIWAHPYAQPRPEIYTRAQARIQEIITQHLTIEMAEAFIQANIGKNNPYLGIIFLRLGELYEQEGNLDAAKDVYQLIVESFPNEADWVARAQAHLARLAEP